MHYSSTATQQHTTATCQCQAVIDDYTWIRTHASKQARSTAAGRGGRMAGW